MKTKEEMNALKEEVEPLNKKLSELTEEELKPVTGGTHVTKRFCPHSSGCTTAPADCSVHFGTNHSSPYICPKT